MSSSAKHTMQFYKTGFPIYAISRGSSLVTDCSGRAGSFIIAHILRFKYIILQKKKTKNSCPPVSRLTLGPHTCERALYTLIHITYAPSTAYIYISIYIIYIVYTVYILAVCVWTVEGTAVRRRNIKGARRPLRARSYFVYIGGTHSKAANQL